MASLYDAVHPISKVLFVSIARLQQALHNSQNPYLSRTTLIGCFVLQVTALFSFPKGIEYIFCRLQLYVAFPFLSSCELSSS